jgi:hypothetical protein
MTLQWDQQRTFRCMSIHFSAPNSPSFLSFFFADLLDALQLHVCLANRCETCGMNHFSCPGHPGHIELCVPVYHPLFFARLYKLMKSICLHCHKFRVPEEEVRHNPCPA